MYEKARASFEGILATGPDCAIAQWGVATMRCQPLWPTRPTADDLMRGWSEIPLGRRSGPRRRRS